MTAPLDFSTVTNALPASAFGLAIRIGYEAFGILHADMAGKPLDLGRLGLGGRVSFFMATLLCACWGSATENC